MLNKMGECSGFCVYNQRALTFKAHPAAVAAKRRNNNFEHAYRCVKI